MSGAVAEGGRTTAHWQVRGRVQGVFFRASTRDRARQLGLDGWVRNRDDGSVEVAVAGPAAAVAELREYVAQGPRHARVEAVEELEALPEEDDWKGFQVRHR